MASFEQIIKFENEKPKGVVRLVEANGFYRAYNHSAYLFHQAIARHKVRVVDAYKGVEFLGAFIKPYRTYPATRTLRRLRGRLKSLDWSERPKRIQARVNSMLGVLSHYDCWHVRKVLTWEARLREFGEVTDDCLRFHPDVLKIMVGSRVPRDRDGRASPPGESQFEGGARRSAEPGRGAARRDGSPHHVVCPTGEGSRV